MITVYVNKIKVNIEKNSSVFQACEKVGITIPRFCYHEKLLIAGNCRICLVEIEKSPKPVASCAIPLMEGIKIFTDSPLVKKARETTIEVLLINHPLDCPVCDQGGECDLQEQAWAYGTVNSRYMEPKRATEQKYLSFFVKTAITRCIHCTRCIRYLAEKAGEENLGVTNRGNTIEIGLYVERKLKTYLSGNILDLCPVAAITVNKYKKNADN